MSKLIPVASYPDGSASYKAGNGGWSFVAVKGKETAELYGFSDKTTISEMELMGIHNTLEWLPVAPAPLRIFCDSQYAVNCMNVWAARWEECNWFSGVGKRPSHWLLIKRMRELLALHRKARSVSIVWIPGHSKHVHNERADFLAGKARKERLCNYAPPVARLRE